MADPQMQELIKVLRQIDKSLNQIARETCQIWQTMKMNPPSNNRVAAPRLPRRMPR